MSNTIRSALAGVTGALVLTAFASVAGAQEPAVHRMEINNGPVRTVRYFGRNLSPSDDAMLRSLEWTENELSYVRNLQETKKQFVETERRLEPVRRQFALQNYGVSRTVSAIEPAGLAGLGIVGAGGGFSIDGFGGRGYPYYGAGSYPYAAGFGLGLGSLIGGGSAVNSATSNGGESVIKTAMAGTIASQATPEYAALVEQAHERSLVRASETPAIRTAAGLPSGKGGEIRPVEFARGPIVLTLKTGEKVTGTKLEEKGEWYILTAPGRTSRVRISEVQRIDEQTGKGVRPASE
jgi:hypothetical protein